jgi:signal transduction histidine kinase
VKSLKSLYFRIYITVVAALALFAAVSGWLLQRHLAEERSRAEVVVRDRVAAWGELLQRSLPPADAPAEEQAAALNDWSQRLRVPMALDDAKGRRIASSDFFMRRDLDNPAQAGRLMAIKLDDGRQLWVARMGLRGQRLGGPGGPRLPGAGPGEANGSGGINGPPPDLRMPGFGPPTLPGVPDGVGLAVLLVVLFLAVAGGAWPVVRRLTRRLEALKLGVEAFGAGQLRQRVAEDGGDEVAALGASFNRAAGRIEALLRSHQSLLANASHELRSPLARLKMAVSLMEDAPDAQRAALKREVDTNIAELDSLVEEVLLASRLDAAGAQDLGKDAPVPLLAIAAEEAARTGASVQGGPGAAALQVRGDERLLRRALRNLLENARRYGGDAVEVTLDADAATQPPALVLRVCDRGPGVPPAYRERIFEAFFRLPGHAEREGGVGLGLALVRQIALRHGGSVACLPRDGGGSCFELRLPGV